MTRWVLFLSLVACACPSKQTATPNVGSSGGSGAVGSGGTAQPAANTCDGAKARVEQLYRAEAQAKEPKRVDEAVADNTAMVMADCAKDPAKFVPCINAAKSVADLEKQCLVPIDDEGTEGEAK